MSESPNRIIFPSRIRKRPYDDSVDVLRDDLLHDHEAVRHVGNIYVKRMEYYKNEGLSQHEFLALHVCDKTDTSRQNVLILHRVPEPGLSAGLAVQGAAQGVDNHVERGNPRPSQGLSSIKSLYSLAPRDAGDCFVIAMSNDLESLRSYKGLTGPGPIIVHEIEHQDLTIEKVIVVACLVTAHHPEYTLEEYQCYWYALTVWVIIRDLAGINNPNPLPPNLGRNTSFKTSIKPHEVSPESRPEALRGTFDQHWADFLKEVEERRALGPAAKIEAAEAREAEARAAAEASERDVRAAKAREAEIQAAAEAEIRAAKAREAEIQAAAEVEIRAAEKKVKELSIELEELRRQAHGTKLSSD
ncbi:hypothetical protein FRC06_009918 [Ceratobasidium sp. 370]|nr:hypothetical protein FRC06_009918 [Ceratobasidium sp. 370]